MYMGMDTLDTEVLKDVRVRRAINHAVDKNVIIQGVLKGLGKPQGLSGASLAKGYDDSIKPYPYDPEKARALLEEAGYPDGFQLDLHSPSHRYPMDKEVTQAVADQLSKIGIQCSVNVHETQKYFKSFVKHTMRGMMFLGQGYTGWDIHSLVMQVNPKAPFSYWHHPEMNKMIDVFSSTMDTQARFAVAFKMQHMMHDQAVNLFLYDLENAYGLSTKVNGFEARADDHMYLWNVSLK
jgi:peptide/nickel transport system substrate-binding protein